MAFIHKSALIWLLTLLLNILRVQTVVLTSEDFAAGEAYLIDLASFAGDDSGFSDEDDSMLYSEDKMEGDIRLSGGPDLGPGVQQNAIRDPGRLWPNGRIPYQMSSDFDSIQRGIIAASFLEFQKETCVEFVPKEDKDTSYIYLFGGDGCWSEVGMQVGQQEVSLHPLCFKKYGIIVHELLHALGFWHEQARRDRDDFITIEWSNIARTSRYNFEKQEKARIQDLDEPYDYASVMHYGVKAFTQNGRPTITAKNTWVKIGQRNGFSDGDLRKVNKLYQCIDDDSGCVLKCQDGAGSCSTYNKADCQKYQGRRSITWTGLPCQKFSSQTPHQHNYTLLGDHNFCRSDDADAPWCFTTYPRKRWDYCFELCPKCSAKPGESGSCIQTCSDGRGQCSNYNAADCFPYQGDRSITIDGTPCQRFSWQIPHQHNTRLGDHSRCRSDDADAPWCFTMNAKVRWQYCFAKCPTCTVAQGRGSCVQFCAGKRVLCANYGSSDCNNYSGNRAFTVSEIPCQSFSSQYPHQHSYGKFGSHNYCRSTDADAPWCYTIDSEKRWEYCFPSCAQC